MSRRKDSIPLWLPFGLVASFLVMIGAGVRSGWKTQADASKSSLKDWFG